MSTPRPSTISFWPRPHVARVATFADGSSCTEHAPDENRIVRREIDPPTGWWHARGWAEDRAKMLGGTAEETHIGEDGKCSERASHHVRLPYGRVPEGCELCHSPAMAPPWYVWGRVNQIHRQVFRRISCGDPTPWHAYSEVLRAWERIYDPVGDTHP